MLILRLTVRAEEIERVFDLEVGAEEYLTNPYSMRGLQARGAGDLETGSDELSKDAAKGKV